MDDGDGHDTARGGQAGALPVDPVADVAVALTALRRVHDWFCDQSAAATSDHGDKWADETAAGLGRQVIVGLGHVDALAMAARIRSIIAAEDLGLAERDGVASPVEWLADALRMTRAEASRESKDAAALHDRRPTMTALASGAISRGHARQLAQSIRQQERDQQAAERARQAEDDRRRRERAQADALAARQAADEAERRRLAAEAAERERVLAQQARLDAERRQREADAARDSRQADLLDRAASGASAEQVKDAADEHRSHDPDALERDAAAAFARRHLQRWRDRTTGLAMTKIGLPDDVDEQLQALIESVRTFDPPQTPPDERRSPEQRDADAFIDIIDAAARAGSLPTSHGTRPQITLTAPVKTLLGGDQPGRGRNGTLLSAETVRRLACDANLTRAILNATGVVLDLGTSTPRWSASQYRAIAASFTGCAFPIADGTPCDRPIGWCDIHHVNFVQNGGPTDLANGVPLCRRHHNAVHHQGWTLTYDQPSHTTTVSRKRNGTTTTRAVTHARHKSTSSVRARPHVSPAGPPPDGSGCGAQSDQRGRQADPVHKPKPVAQQPLLI